PVLGLLAAEASHLGAGVTLDHALTLEKTAPALKSLRSRRAACRSDRAARSIETRDGGVGGPCRGPPRSMVQELAREVPAIEGPQRGQDEAVLVEELGDERLHLLVA